MKRRIGGRRGRLLENGDACDRPTLHDLAAAPGRGLAGEGGVLGASVGGGGTGLQTRRVGHGRTASMPK